MNIKQLAIALVAAFGLMQGVGAAQITAPIDADIPFQFVVGNTTLAPGKYLLTARGDEELEIHSINGPTGVLHTVFQAEANSEPRKTELIFHRYGNREFLTKVFIEGSSEGVELTQSKLEKELMDQGQSAVVHSHPGMRHLGRKESRRTTS